LILHQSGGGTREGDKKKGKATMNTKKREFDPWCGKRGY